MNCKSMKNRVDVDVWQFLRDTERNLIYTKTETLVNRKYFK